MKRLGIGTAVLAGAATMAIIGGGTASAFPAPVAPTADYMICGMAYSGGGSGAVVDGKSTPAPAGAVAASGKVIVASLWTVFNTQVDLDPANVSPDGKSVLITTNSSGDWCYTGSSTLATTVTTGGTVRLQSAGGTTTHPSINALDFLDHKDATFNSATGFNFKY
ncbi:MULTISPECIES: hypothetical protein [Rhodococcus]|jgi:hypothetical protein|uniref:Uncharacterized protein n=2 Tax=Rhodococcus erythropolis TaxID=1833 RepID=C0ZUJ0_RHOE4|nr:MULTISPECIES: hypothetical protein [Rhodococcus]MCZ9633005.1 hypothetical protein [Rhodococcus sp. BH5]RAL36487.1 hypothetical protein CVN56_04920 [Rhodococcus sp. AQ5-07]WMN02085.1 hypothetical protein QIE55_30485 [Rhodococcus erythropolis]BAH32235.1 hypothetical protein RER_15270 [Rhodococcus erythropolis PR4]